MVSVQYGSYYTQFSLWFSLVWAHEIIYLPGKLTSAVQSNTQISLLLHDENRDK